MYPDAKAPKKLSLLLASIALLWNLLIGSLFDEL